MSELLERKFLVGGKYEVEEIAHDELVLWMVRHELSESNKDEKYKAISSSDVELSNEGKRKAIELAKAFSSTPNLIVSSPFKRARDTAAPLRERFPDVPYEEWPIQEFGYMEFPNTNREQRQPWVNSYWRRMGTCYQVNSRSESFMMLADRAWKIRNLIMSQIGRYKFIVAISHEQFMKQFDRIVEIGDPSLWGFEDRELEMGLFDIGRTSPALRINNGEIRQYRFKQS